MNVEIWIKAAQFLFWEHKNGMFVAVRIARHQLIERFRLLKGGGGIKNVLNELCFTKKQC
jgi:hypothetical protein